MPIEASPRNAAHLWRRAAFGATPAEIERTVADGIEATVATMFDHGDAPPAGGPARTRGEFAYDPEALTLWFVRLAATSPTPALERLMWFWHGHFATNVHKFEDAELLHRQLLMLRRHGLGRFDDLCKLMHRDAAMILWLDLDASIAGRHNENYAREFLELFTLGVDGGFTQGDVSEASRAFTGHTVTEARPYQGLLRAGLHDAGDKTILGHTGPFDADDVVDLVVARPECHRFIARRFWTRYAGTEPSDAVLEDLAAAFRDRLTVIDLVTEVLTHPAFYADDVRHALVSQPVESVIRAVRGFGLELFDVTAAPIPEDGSHDESDDRWYLPLEWLDAMGQRVGEPPDVGGWPHNDPWLDTTRAAGRLAAALSFAEHATASDSATVHAVRVARRAGPDAVVAEIFAAYGVTEWSNETAAAMRTALHATGDPFDSLAATIAVAFTSPEVVLS